MSYVKSVVQAARADMIRALRIFPIVRRRYPAEVVTTDIGYRLREYGTSLERS